ncbi:E4 ORF2 [Bat mastadenovirus WIV13]|uniref:E4 ORF2 n=1 Tax=Bat mastadenovirus WIV13 TaxID=1788435 RepID=A0A1B0UHZ0_9ADEN|nr:E4 ORF2 [Bat mastadenovirus WIV13]AMB43043.1 E4 ORF2 [Bat mastadenovirus WIV13]
MRPQVYLGFLLQVKITEEFKNAFNFVEPSFTVHFLKICMEEFYVIWDLEYCYGYHMYVGALPSADYLQFTLFVAGKEHNGHCWTELKDFASIFEKNLRFHYRELAREKGLDIDCSQLTVSPLENWMSHE